MTENEAIERIKSGICNEIGTAKYCHDNCMHGIEHCAYSMAIQALEEIQQYRAIGTVEGYENAIKAYTETYILMKEYKSKLQEFEAIGTIDEFKALKQKATPKKPDYEADGYADGELVYDYAKCPICEHDFEYGINDWECEYCSDCGQKLDWSE